MGGALVREAAAVLRVLSWGTQMSTLDPAIESAPPARPARSWPRAIAWAAAAVYVPQLLPLAATDLLEHGHCLGLYARIFPILVGLAPGFSARMAMDLGEPWEEVVLFAVAGLVTLAVVGGAALALRRWRRGGPAVAAGVALLTAWLALAAVAILRA
jgi:hypothetical protein